jgi:hypothetical protein
MELLVSVATEETGEWLQVVHFQESLVVDLSLVVVVDLSLVVVVDLSLVVVVDLSLVVLVDLHLLVGLLVEQQAGQRVDPRQVPQVDPPRHFDDTWDNSAASPTNYANNENGIHDCKAISLVCLHRDVRVTCLLCK